MERLFITFLVGSVLGLFSWVAVKFGGTTVTVIVVFASYVIGAIHCLINEHLTNRVK